MRIVPSVARLRNQCVQKSTYADKTGTATDQIAKQYVPCRRFRGCPIYPQIPKVAFLTICRVRTVFR